jgi:hypothetical protein
LKEFLGNQEHGPAAAVGNAIQGLVDAHTRHALQYDDISIGVFQKQ